MPESRLNMLSDEEKYRVEGVVARFGNEVSEYEVVQWLENFEDEDRTNALIVLEHMQYYTMSSIYESVKKNLEYIVVPKRAKGYIVPVGATGKSGSAVAYYIQKVLPRRTRLVCVSAGELAEYTIKENDVLCLVDDFVGSGQTIAEFYAQQAESFSRFSKKIAFVLAYMPGGKEVIENLGFTILGNEHYPVFSRRNSVFGGEHQMRTIREFAYKYGKRIFPNARRGSVENQPLGYANSQALIAFNYTTPNNTLPIIWANTYRGADKEYDWHPLFPRDGRDFIQRLCSIRRNYWLWLQCSKELKSPFIKDDEIYSVEKVKLLMLLDLIHTHRSRCIWEQLLGVTGNELENIIAKAKEYGYVNEQLQLRPIAKRLIQEVKRSQKLLSGEEEKLETNKLAYNYVPNRFMGGS